MKRFILCTIFCDVLVLPCGLPPEGSALGAPGAFRFR
jgi:hypothetical protein